MRLFDKIPTDFSTVALFDIIAKVIVGVGAVFLIRILSVDDYAVYVKFNAIASLIFGVAGTSLTTTFVRSGAELKSREKDGAIRIYAICLVLLAIVALLTLVLYPLFDEVYLVAQGVFFSALLYGLLQSVNKINQGYFQIDGKFARAGVYDNIKNTIQCAAFFAIWFFWGKANIMPTLAIFEISILVPVAASFISILRCETKSKRRSSAQENHLGSSVYKEVLHESALLIVYWLLLSLIDQVGVVFLGLLADETAVAVYGVAFRYYALLLTLQGSLNVVFRIRTSTKEMIDDASARRSFSIKWIKKTWTFVLLFFVLINLFCAPVMTLLNGAEYDASIMVFRVLVVGVMVSYLFSPNAALVMSAKKYGSLAVCCLVGLSAGIAIDVCLIPVVGVLAAAIGTVFAYAILNIACFCIVHRSNKGSWNG